jgi:hypothetical protein
MVRTILLTVSENILLVAFLSQVVSTPVVTLLREPLIGLRNFG